MMGMQAVPAQLFYDFSIEEHVPADHLLRRIDQFLDLKELRTKLKPYYSAIGRPSIDPELMIRMLTIGYSMGIRSERRLCEEVHLNLAYRWFCKLGLEGKVPDHSTFSRCARDETFTQPYRDRDVLRGCERGTGSRSRLSQSLCGNDPRRGRLIGKRHVRRGGGRPIRGARRRVRVRKCAGLLCRTGASQRPDDDR
jgi:hypothetical protein